MASSSVTTSDESVPSITLEVTPLDFGHDPSEHMACLLGNKDVYFGKNDSNTLPSPNSADALALGPVTALNLGNREPS